MTHPKLPDHIAEALTDWARDNHLDHHDVTQAVRDALPAGEPVMVTTSGEGRMITTSIPVSKFNGFRRDTAIKMLLPRPGLEVLEYANDHMEDGSISTRDGEPVTRVRITVGTAELVGEWVWAAGPEALVGLHVGPHM